MFQRMHREDEYPGTGVGLAIVKKCVERMNGHVGFESEVGKGSKFWIELPKTAVPATDEHLQSVHAF
jgi:signal transduction histidine kinase